MNLPETTKCAPPNCKEYFLKEVTTPEHIQLARRAAAQSIVLLKNQNEVLPLSPASAKSIAIIGAAADAPSYDPNGAGQGQGGDWATGDYYSGGGSGHLAGNVVTPFDGLRAKAKSLNMEVMESLTDDPIVAAQVAKKVDIAIIVAGTTSGESRDRLNLNLDGDVDKLIDAVRKVAKKTIVLVAAPGAVVMPWRNEVDGIAIMFLGGQETGHAWADVLFGEQVPTGRLPIMLPETEADTVWPSDAADVPYTEGLATSYRNPAFKAAFPFGHGLTYTTFEHEAPVNKTCAGAEGCQYRLRTCVRNAGEVAAPTVVQLYLEFPPQAGQPAPLLKAFKRTRAMAPGVSEEITFDLSTRDLSYWDVGQDDWVQATGSFVAHIGESSADIRHSFKFCNGPCTQEGSNLGVVIGGLGAVAALLVGGVAAALKLLSKKPGYTSIEEMTQLASALLHDA